MLPAGYIDECVSSSEDPPVLQLESCQDGLKPFKGIMIQVAGFIFVWLLEIWACSVVQLWPEEQAVKDTENWWTVDC